MKRIPLFFLTMTLALGAWAQMAALDRVDKRMNYFRCRTGSTFMVSDSAKTVDYRAVTNQFKVFAWRRQMFDEVVAPIRQPEAGALSVYHCRLKPGENLRYDEAGGAVVVAPDPRDTLHTTMDVYAVSVADTLDDHVRHTYILKYWPTADNSLTGLYCKFTCTFTDRALSEHRVPFPKGEEARRFLWVDSLEHLHPVTYAKGTFGDIQGFDPKSGGIHVPDTAKTIGFDPAVVLKTFNELTDGIRNHSVEVKRRDDLALALYLLVKERCALLEPQEVDFLREQVDALTRDFELTGLPQYGTILGYLRMTQKLFKKKS